MVLPISAGLAAAAFGLGGGGGGGGSLLGNIARSGGFGGLIGGAVGGLFGGRSGGFGRALRRSLRANTASLQRGVENFENFSGRFLDQFREASPVFGALESRVLSDLDDSGRTARLETAFQRRLGQQQASRGLLRSPSAALQSSFAGLQFQEQLRNQAFDRAIGFQTQLAQPLTAGFFRAGLPNIQGDIGFQSQAFDFGARQQRNQSILSGFSEGFNTGIGFGGRAGLFPNRARPFGVPGQFGLQ